MFDKFVERWELFSKVWEGSLLLAVLFIASLTVLYYFMFKFLKENGAGLVMWVFICVTVLVGIMAMLAPKEITRMFVFMPIILVLMTVLIYSVEIKRVIWRQANIKFIDNKHNIKNFDEAEIGVCIDEIIKALQNMSKNDIGAILVLSNGNVPDKILQSGVTLNSDITSQLIESVFFPKTPLHDGAMIINGTKIVAAGCFLPLSQKENLSKELGTRHRAGIGITETIDVTTIIVSEETGIISIVKAGNITRYADSEMLRKTLSKFYWQDLAVKK